MSNLPLLAASATVAAVVSAAVMLFARPGDVSGTESAATHAEVTALHNALDEIRAQNNALGAEVASLRAAGPASAVSREPVVEDLVARAVAKAMADIEANASGAYDKTASNPEGFDLNASLAALIDPFVTSEDRERLWTEAHEAGKTQELIALVEARAKADPKNVALQYELANAYIQPIIRDGATGVDAANWSMKADQMYDVVLGLDENHWEARFSKAVSYSFWPPLFGKQQAAIDHFEILVSKQSNMTPRPEFSQTYLFLGNMYEQAGNAVKAKEAWNLGLSAFPQDKDLRTRLGLQ